MGLATLDDEEDAELMMEFRNRYWDKWVQFCLEQRFQPMAQDTKIVKLNGKRFHLETDYDSSAGVTGVRLTECGDPNATEMLEAYDLEPIE